MIGEALKDLLRYLPGRILPAVAALAAIPALTRLLPPDQYGRYTLGLNTVNLFVALTASWVTASAIRFVPTYEDRSALSQGLGLHTALFLATLAVATTLLAAAAVTLAVTRTIPASFALLVVVLCVMTAGNEFLLGLLRSRRMASTLSWLMAVNGIGSYALAVILTLLLPSSSLTVLVGFLLAVALVLPLAAHSAFRHAAPELTSLRGPAAREALRFGLPGLLSNSLTWLTTLSDRYVLAVAHGAHSVGIYAAGKDLADRPLLVINTLFVLASLPVGIRVWEQRGETAARMYVADLTRYFLVIVTPLAVGVAVLAKPLVTVVADPRYHEAYRVVPLVATGALIAGLASRYTMGLYFHKRTDRLGLCYLSSAVVSVGLNLLLVPRYSWMAAAFANVAALVTLLVMTWLMSRPLFRWEFPAGAAMRVAAGAAGMAAAVGLVTRAIPSPSWGLAAGAVVGAVVYLGVLLATGVVTASERAALARFLGLSRSPQ